MPRRPQHDSELLALSEFLAVLKQARRITKAAPTGAALALKMQPTTTLGAPCLNRQKKHPAVRVDFVVAYGRGHLAHADLLFGAGAFGPR
jgi:hypothetical protein